MPMDSRRLPVPDESHTPLSFSKVDKDSKRQDGRMPTQVRPIFIKSGVITQAKGSAYMELQHTKVICAVYGPREVIRREDFSLKGQVQCELKFATFSSEIRRGHQQNSEERKLSRILQEALEPAIRLEKFPKARLDVYVTVLQDDGSAVAAAISCASVAVAAAGVEMYDLVCGCNVRQEGDLVILDPTAQEDYNLKNSESRTAAAGSVTVGFMPSLNQVSAIVQKGQLELHDTNQCMKLCTDTCHQTYPVLQQCLVKAVKSRQHQNT